MGALLVAGTSIGAGMLALPVVSAEGGFFPSLFVYFLCYGFMSTTGLLLLELCLKLPPGANLVSMAKIYLGRGGEIFAWAVYLFLFYSLSVAYIAGGSSLISSLLPLGERFCQILFVLVLGSIVYWGAFLVGRLNFLFMLGLIGSYLVLVFLGVRYIQVENLKVFHVGKTFSALPVIFTSFSYQGIVPSLTEYLKRDGKSIARAILGGTTLAFGIYVLWQLVILGIVPKQELIEAKKLGQSAIFPLRQTLSGSWIGTLGQIFAFFAIITSFLGVTLGLFDFLADGLKLVKKGYRKLFLAFLTFFPPLVVVFFIPSVFIIALVFAGSIGCALLLGLLPTMMCWVSRYAKIGHEGPIFVPGGKGVLFLLIAFVLFEIISERLL